MNFDTGLIDRLFGKRIEITTDTATGPKSVWVTEKWFAKMVAEGKITPDTDRISEGQTETPRAVGTQGGTQRPEMPIEEAVSLFLNSVRKHVEKNWPNCVRQLPELLPSASNTLLEFLHGDGARILMVHAMFAVELRDARSTYPVHLVGQIEALALDTIRVNMGKAGEQFAAMTTRFLLDYDEAAENGLRPLFGIGGALSLFTQAQLSETTSEASHLELGKAMFAAATSLQQDWWAVFASQMKLEVGA
jgi:hypothetical protein